MSDKIVTVPTLPICSTPGCNRIGMHKPVMLVASKEKPEAIARIQFQMQLCDTCKTDDPNVLMTDDLWDKLVTSSIAMQRPKPDRTLLRIEYEMPGNPT